MIIVRDGARRPSSGHHVRSSLAHCPLWITPDATVSGTGACEKHGCRYGLTVQPAELIAHKPGAVGVDTTSTVAVRANPVVSVAVTVKVYVPARRSTLGYT
jgi:hypothetical protein